MEYWLLSKLIYCTYAFFFLWCWTTMRSTGSFIKVKYCHGASSQWMWSLCFILGSKMIWKGLTSSKSVLGRAAWESFLVRTLVASAHFPYTSLNASGCSWLHYSYPSITWLIFFGWKVRSLVGLMIDSYILYAAWSDHSFCCLMQFQWVIQIASITRPISLRICTSWTRSAVIISCSILFLLTISLAGFSWTSSFSSRTSIGCLVGCVCVVSLVRAVCFSS